MFSLTFSYLFLLFATYSIIGWSCEVIYCGILAKKLVNRGFLHGPWCPVYGFGALFVIGLLTPFKGRIYILYPASLLLTGLLEYATGWLLETLFHTKWWDYSNRKFNIKGRVCLFNLLLFAMGGSLAVVYVHPFFSKIIGTVPTHIRQYAALSICALFVFDLALTLRKLIDFTEYLTSLQDFAESLRERYEHEAWFTARSVTDMFTAVRQQAKLRQGEISERILKKMDTLSAHHPAVERFFRKFPSIQNTRQYFSVQHIKEKINAKLKSK